MNYKQLLLTIFPFLFCACGPDLPEEVAEAYAALPERVDFNQHIRPILSDRCWSCHGPDAGARQADLRLDTEEDFRTVQGQIVARITSDDPDFVMPTPESKITLTDIEKATIAKWIERGAEWKDHWAFLPIERPEIPQNPEGFPEPVTTVDNFVNAALAERTTLAPAGRARDEVLIRRLYQDLTGLPPTIEDIDAWLADPSEEAYRARVEELLATEAHAERLTMEWLDVARYADSHGMHADGSRLSYPFRDWVIRAFYDNRPYDDFVRQQIAGDLIDEPTQESKLGTAFLRMHPMTAEGGAIDEEFRLGYVFDRVNTVATSLLGLTMDCSRCHDHKFDPISQEEYYSFSAFFNTIDELGMTGDDGNFGPYMRLTDARTDSLLDAYQASRRQLHEVRSALTPTTEELAAFSVQIRPARPALALDFERDPDNGKTIKLSDNLNLVPDAKRGGRVVEFDEGWDVIQLDGQAQIHPHEPMSAAVWVQTQKRDSKLVQSIIGTTSQKNSGWRGMEFILNNENRPVLRLTHQLPDDQIEVMAVDSLQVGEWTHLAFSYDGTGAAASVRLYVNGRPVPTRVLNDNLRGSFHPVEAPGWMSTEYYAMRVGQAWRNFTGDNAIFRGRMDDLNLYYEVISPLEVARLAGRDAPGQDAKLIAAGTARNAYRALTQQLRDLEAKRWPVEDTILRMMVMEEMTEPRKTYLLDRGAYDAPTKEVLATTPARVLPFDESLPRNRAGLAEWLLNEDNPLLARVVVNRYWQLIFGRGLVDTPHDFGSQGSLPTHPKLLDHLAYKFRTDWDVRDLIRTIVLSDTYRRSSIPTEEMRGEDPENLLLARGARYRMPAELIRDNALAAAGLLNDRVGGKSVRPYQPDGLWKEKSNFSHDLAFYQADAGDKLYRRTMYTFIRRTSPPPFLTNFDASGRDVCLVKRSETNTPLQALNLLNDPQFVEAARVLAERVQREGPERTDLQLSHAFRLVTGRQPTAEETKVLADLYSGELTRFETDQKAAKSLLAVGDYPVPRDLDPQHTAALASVSNVLLNLDEAYVKQ